MRSGQKMKEYIKINNLFKFDEKYRTIVGMSETYDALKNIIWEGTEKIDGTNIRIYWDGHKIEFSGRTDKSTIPDELKVLLEKLFLTQEMEYVFEQLFEDKDVILYGEGYGPKIQKGGDYSKDTKFILFDIEINDFYLSRKDVNEIAERLGIDSVPVVFKGTLDEAIAFVKEHHMSTLGEHQHEMEGLVLQPMDIVLYDNKKKPLKCKCKYRDIVKQ